MERFDMGDCLGELGCHHQRWDRLDWCGLYDLGFEKEICLSPCRVSTRLVAELLLLAPLDLLYQAELLHQTVLLAISQPFNLHSHFYELLTMMKDQDFSWSFSLTFFSER